MIRITVKRNQDFDRRFPGKSMWESPNHFDRQLDIAKTSQRNEWIESIKAGRSIYLPTSYGKQGIEFKPSELIVKRGAWCSTPNYATHGKVSSRPGKSYQVPCPRSATHTWTNMWGYQKPMCQDHAERHIRVYGDRNVVKR